MRANPARLAWDRRFFETGELSKSDVLRRSAGLGFDQKVEGGHPVAGNQEPEHDRRGKRPGNNGDGRGRRKHGVLEPAEMTNLVVAIISVMTSRWVAVGRRRFVDGVLVFVTGFGGGSWKERQQQTKQQQGRRQQRPQPNGLSPALSEVRLIHRDPSEPPMLVPFRLSSLICIVISSGGSRHGTRSLVFACGRDRQEDVWCVRSFPMPEIFSCQPGWREPG